MRRLERRFRAFASILVMLAGAGTVGPLHSAAAAGRDGGTRAAPAAPRASASSPASSAALPTGHPPTGAGTLPPGHPAMGAPDDGADDGEDELPPGHPRPQAPGPRAANAQEQLPEDASDVDKTLPAGTIAIEIRDAQDRPVPRADVTLGILQQSVAKGESRRHVPKQADDQGNLRFDGLETGTGIAYRITVPVSGPGTEPATYAAMPFQLDLHNGQRVRIHVYPVTNRIGDAMVGMDGIVYMELKDDVIQLDELFRIYNLGAVTWVPTDVVVTLPHGFKAFNAQKEMSDAGWDEVPGKGAKLHGTFSPGQHETHFRYQIPYDGDEAVELSTTLPPRVARMRVMAEASKGMTLQVRDFPSSISDRNQAGQRILLTERQARSGEAPVSDVRIALENIPTEGPAKWIATVIAASTVAFGLYLALEQEKKKSAGKKALADQDAERARSRLVTEIAELDKARASGEVGPKAYDRIRGALVDALARLMATA
jgi:hypothetical protein